MAVLGIDIGATSVKLAVVNGDENIIACAQCPSVKGDPDKMADRIAAAGRALGAGHLISRIGVSCAGAVDAQGNSTADNLGWRDAPIRALLEKRFQLPVAIDNDGHCAMLAERKSGALRGLSHAIYLTLGTGIGAGVIVDHMVLRGKRGESPELGHMITHADGLPCACGANGCFEVYASAAALTRMSGGRSPLDVVEAARRGEVEAATLWRAYLHELAVGLIGLMSIFYPQAVVLGGGLSNAGAFLIDGVGEALRDISVFGVYYSDVEVRPARFRNDAGVLGAAMIAMERA